MNQSKFFPSHRRSHRFVATWVAAVVCPFLFWLQLSISPPETPINDGSPVLNSPFFKLATAGYWPAAVDWKWIQTLQLIGGKHFPPELKPLAKNFYDIATDLDPRFYELYEQGAMLFSFYFKAPDEAIQLLEKGINNISVGWSHPYTLHLLAAYLYSYDLRNWAKAKEHYLLAADLPGSPAYLKGMRSWLEEKDSEKILAKRVLTILIRQTTDEVLKKEYEERLKSL